MIYFKYDLNTGDFTFLDKVNLQTNSYYRFSISNKNFKMVFRYMTEHFIGSLSLTHSRLGISDNILYGSIEIDNVVRFISEIIN
jgi:hypothetical protein